MPGGLMQLIAYGAADVFLTGSPEITFFKSVFKRYTNFSIEYIDLAFETLPTFNSINSKEVTCMIDRNADLLSEVYVVFQLPTIRSPRNLNFKWIKNLGINLIEEISIFIGGQLIDRHRNHHLNFIEELRGNLKSQEAYDYIIGNTPDLFNPYIDEREECYVIKGRKLFIPLKFWFCLNDGLSLPLIALQYVETEIRVKFRAINQLFTIGFDNISPSKYISLNNDFALITGFEELIYGNWNQDAHILAKYIYLDEKERKLFANNTHEYIVPQIQYETFGGIKEGPNIIELNLYLPVKMIQWAFVDQSVIIDNNTHLNYLDVLKDATLLINGHERTKKLEGDFFSSVIQYKYFRGFNPGIYSYLFCIDPLSVKPTGTSNFSRMNNIELHFTIDFDKTITNINKDNTLDVHIISTNYNVLRIMNGLAGMVFNGT